MVEPPDTFGSVAAGTFRARLHVAVDSVGIFIVLGFSSAFAQTYEPENIILGRPAADSIAVHVRAAEGTEVFAEYGQTPGASPGAYTGRTAAAQTSADNLMELSLEGLQPNTRYYYRVSYRRPGASEDETGQEYSFHTGRPRGSTFSFGVQSDSHPERPGPGRMFHTDLYTRTMENVAADQPDLYFTLGDDFSISNQMYDFFQGDRNAMTQATVDAVYLNQRNYFGVMAHSTSLFLVNGNHEEARRHLLGTPLHDVSIFAGNARTRIFPLPAPEFLFPRGLPVRRSPSELGVPQCHGISGGGPGGLRQVLPAGRVRIMGRCRGETRRPREWRDRALVRHSVMRRSPGREWRILQRTLM